MSETNLQFSHEDAVEAAAARWIARSDRGLSESEQAAYSKWLGEDPRHGAAMRRPGKNWSALDQLAQHFPMAGNDPDPDLLAPPRPHSRWLWIPALAAAAVAVIFWKHVPAAEPEIITYSNAGKNGAPHDLVHAAPSRAIVRLEPDRHVLKDGSIVELNALATVTVRYTPTERSVQLIRGEAYFIVAKNPRRPFRVTANQVVVQAVGTAFSVGLGRKETSVLVTEGKVRVDQAPVSLEENPVSRRELSALQAGQQGVFDVASTPSGAPAREAEVKALTSAEVDVALSWRNLQLEFTDLPLREIVAEFNRHNRQQLIVANAETAAIRMSGIFRADNLAAFVSLLPTGLGVTATEHEGKIILEKAHGP